MDPELTLQEQEMADRIDAAGRSSGNTGTVIAALTAGMALIFAYHQRRLAAATAEDTPDPKSLWDLSGRILQDTKLRLAAVLVPAITTAIIDGVRQSRTPSPWMSAVAAQYADGIIDAVHQTSVEALVSGYQAQINRRVVARRALNNVVGAFGVPTRTMNTLVNLWTKKLDDPSMTSTPAANSIADRADHLINEALKARINAIANTEAHSSKAMGKAIMWLYASEQGQLPSSTMKMWMTAKDEKTCAVCGPMHKVKVRINEKFTLPTGEQMWGPGVHPNCRCDMRLATSLREVALDMDLEEVRDEELVAKSAFGVVHKARAQDRFDRDRNGRFATTESRTVKPVATKQKTDPRVAEILRQADALAGTIDREVKPTQSMETAARMDTPQRMDSKQRMSAAQSMAPAQSMSNSSSMSASAKEGSLARGSVSRGTYSAYSLIDQGMVDRNREAALSIRPKGEFVPFAEKHESKLKPNEKWVNTPDGKPWYGLLTENWMMDRQSQTVEADESVGFHTARSGQDHLKSAVYDYWNKLINNDMEEIFEEAAGNGWMELMESVDVDVNGEYQVRQTIMYADDNDGENREVDIEAFRAAFLSTLHQTPYQQAPMVEIGVERQFLVDVQGNRVEDPREIDSYGEYEIDYEWETEEVNALDLGKMLGMEALVEDHMPTFIATNYFNVEQGDDPGGIGTATNPGRYNMRSEDRGGDNYHLYFVEPDDLF